MRATSLRQGPAAHCDLAVGWKDWYQLGAALDGCEKQEEEQVITVAPGLAVTLWDSGGIFKAIEKAQASLASINPDIVQLHTTPKSNFAEAVALVRSIVPQARIWVGLPADPLVTSANYKAAVRSYVREAKKVGAEMFVFNGEARWKATGADRTRLGLRAQECIAEVRKAAPGMAVAWTSFDHLASHGLPWRFIFDPEKGVDYHMPQHYTHDPKFPDRLSNHRTVAARVTAADKNSRRLDGAVPDHFLPGGDRWIPYGQMHHHNTAAICALSNMAPRVAYWAMMSRADSHGLVGVYRAQGLRRVEGHNPGHVQAFQGRAGLVADGIVGPATVAKLDLAVVQR